MTPRTLRRLAVATLAATTLVTACGGEDAPDPASSSESQTSDSGAVTGLPAWLKPTGTEIDEAVLDAAPQGMVLISKEGQPRFIGASVEGEKRWEAPVWDTTNALTSSISGKDLIARGVEVDGQQTTVAALDLATGEAKAAQAGFREDLPGVTNWDEYTASKQKGWKYSEQDVYGGELFGADAGTRGGGASLVVLHEDGGSQSRENGITSLKTGKTATLECDGLEEDPTQTAFSADGASLVLDDAVLLNTETLENTCLGDDVRGEDTEVVDVAADGTMLVGTRSTGQTFDRLAVVGPDGQTLQESTEATSIAAGHFLAPDRVVVTLAQGSGVHSLVADIAQ